MNSLFCHKMAKEDVVMIVRDDGLLPTEYGVSSLYRVQLSHM